MQILQYFIKGTGHPQILVICGESWNQLPTTPRDTYISGLITSNIECIQNRASNTTWERRLRKARVKIAEARMWCSEELMGDEPGRCPVQPLIS